MTSKSKKKNTSTFTEDDSSQLNPKSSKSNGNVTALRDQKTTELVFHGKNYTKWRWCFEKALGEKGLRSLLFPSEDENAYIKLSNEQRYAKMRDYAMEQDTAQAILAERLDISYVRRIRSCSTIREMIEKLDREFKSKTDISLISVRKKYLDMRYGEGGDMKIYIAYHEAKADDYEEAGGQISDNEQVMNLHASLPAHFDHILNYYRLSPEETRNYETYHRDLIEAYE